MNSRSRPYLLLSAVLATLLAGCEAAGGPAWTFAPLEPTPSSAASPDPGASPGPGQSADPGQSPGDTLTLEVTTTQDNPLAFEPNQLEAPADSEVTVVYLNDSNVLHNIHFYAGADAGAESLGATELATGPGAEEQVSFTTPGDAGDYFFVCDVHPTMTGNLIVSEQGE